MPKSREGIPEAQKQALRAWVRSQYPRPNHASCITWFKNVFSRTLSQSTVSLILSKEYEYLDNTQGSFVQRRQPPKWPLLDTALFEWQQRIQQAGGLINSEILREKARDFWLQIPEYQCLPIPQFSDGWLNRFKKRHAIRKITYHGEATSIPPSAYEEMKTVRTLCGEFAEEDIYNMDETGLFWRKAPHSGLSNQNMPGIKREKSRISLVVCTNCTGTDRLPLWVIGHAKQPQALRNVNLQGLECIWRYNKRAWMTTIIMSEWLRSFYSCIGRTRKVLLLMDNFSAHQAALEDVPPPPNILVQFFPANSTSVYQPLDQGIIQNLKHYYHKQWLHYMIVGLDIGQNPLHTMNLYYAIRWITRAWRHDVLNMTIYKCFRKSTIIDPKIEHLTAPEPPDLSSLYDDMTKRANIQEAMSLENFLNPSDESHIYESADTSDILSDLTPMDEADAEDLDNEVILAPQPIPTSFEAIQAIQTAIQYAEHHQEVEPEEIRGLEKMERLFSRLSSQQRQQRTLDNFGFIPT